MRILAFLSTLALVGAVFGQTSSGGAAVQFLIDPTKPSVYIQYSEVSISKTDERKRRLRLFNNSRSAIWITTQSAYLQPPYIAPSAATDGIVACFTVECTPLGKMRTMHSRGHRGVGGPHAENRGLKILLPQPEMRREPKLPYRGHGCKGHLLGSYRINSGDSALLKVPSKYLWPRCRFSIRFEYEWGEGKWYERNVLHEVYWP